jgi:hypothetical protein
LAEAHRTQPSAGRSISPSGKHAIEEVHQVPTAEQVRALQGADVAIRVSPEAGGELVEGRLVGTLVADDGLFVFVEPWGEPGRRFSCHYHHIASIEPR